MQTAKESIRQCVKTYIDIFPQEYEAFKSQPKQEVVSANMDTIETKIAEYPENLYALILKTLDDDQMKWFGTKEGVKWFVKTFPVFGVNYASSIV